MIELAWCRWAKHWGSDK